ncbi:hypothetical protein SPV_2475 [Streptococcus pneumoniae]|nr:hypothetical protein SPV_2475 [Streptococcus pneumoniae]
MRCELKISSSYVFPNSIPEE